MPKENRKIAIYFRTKEGTYAIIGDSDKVNRKYKVMRRMTLEQIEFCDRMKSEFENKNHVTVR